MLPAENSADEPGLQMGRLPVGALKLVGRDDGLAAILWERDNPRQVRLGALPKILTTLGVAERQLTEYFQGICKEIDVPFAVAGTSFRARVWRALLASSYGETRSYGDVARQIGHPAAMRAVGPANGRNQVSIMAPCHRVVSSSGTLVASPAAWISNASCSIWNLRPSGEPSDSSRRERGSNRYPLTGSTTLPEGQRRRRSSERRLALT